MKQTNWLAILVCAVIGMGFGFLWYGALFMDIWAEGNNLVTNAEGVIIKNGVEMKDSPLTMIMNTLAMFIYPILLSWLIRRTNMWGLVNGAIVGLTVATFGLIDTVLTNRFAFNPIESTLVDGAYIVVLLVIMGAILGSWKKKVKE